ncbi:hypothetical protein CFE70_000816 [Pyrenophora teres f. teres 0-1]|uniref:Enoyl reductase (ER) domain-containing protein n=1 Tax=Pyrenophora teres f. teres (strain 0-1) TaxID=861557 RepID=E3S3E9_PYRTT|nr:hypothetical protein PTT_16990 [Pyrenophora teres f. teres 0-1]
MPFTLTLKPKKAKGGQVYYPLQLNLVSKPSPGPNDVLIQLEAAALNHRDFFLRQNLYPGLSFKSPMLSDGCGTVIELGPGCSMASNQLLGKKVILTPFRGWESNPEGPEDYSNFSTIGGVEPHFDLGMAQNYICVHESEVELLPEHLSSVEGAAVPCCGITAWRALVTKSGNAKPGRNILVTGIGGGVAIQTLLFGVAMGCNMYVSSSSDEKLGKARQLGAIGTVNYKTESDNWDRTLASLLPPERPYLDAVIDGAGGNIVTKALTVLKPGGVIVCYGMTVGPVMDWPMQAALKNIDLRGTMVGSRAEFREMVEFIRTHRIKPIISRSVKGLDCVDTIDGLFEDIRAGKQFGKLVVEI